MVVKTYRGLLADAGQDRIRLQTIKGKVGYKIIKFEVFAYDPAGLSQESIVKIYKTKQTAVDDKINFTDSELLAAGMWIKNSQNYYVATKISIFDNEIFNQDIYVTHDDDGGSATCNYYIELEVIPLDDAGAEYTTLKDMRQT